MNPCTDPDHIGCPDCTEYRHQIVTAVRRYAFWRGVIFGAVAMFLLTTCIGCSALPTHYAVEVEHVSHPLVGWPFTDRYDEDELTQAQGRASWRADNGAYLDVALGVNVHAAGGFYGPRFTSTLRVGKEWRVSK